MGTQPQPQLGTPRQQRRREVERDAIELVAQHPAHAHVAPGHQREGRQEVLTELLIGDPGGIGRQPLEGQVVDEHRLDAPELDVVGGRVLERPAQAERRSLDLEGQECRVLELSERPLIGIADEGHDLRPDDRGGGVVERVREWRVLPRQELARGHQPLGEGARPEGVPFLEPDWLDLAQQDTVSAIDEAARVPPGCGVPSRALDRRQLRSLPVASTPTASVVTSGAMRPASDTSIGILGRLVATEQRADLVTHQDRHDHDARDGGLDDHAAGREIEVCEHVGQHLVPQRDHRMFPDRFRTVVPDTIHRVPPHCRQPARPDQPGRARRPRRRRCIIPR